jgi:TRAP-type uncharacterized transport system substrate-binding protein
VSAILRSLPFLVLGLILLALLFGAVSVVLRQLDLLPPQELTIAAGAPGTAYHDSAVAYRDVLARDDIELTILETRGSVDNASLLGPEDGPDIALVQGGVPVGEGVDALAAVHVEPLWVFAREVISDDPNRWNGLRVAAGSDGSGTRLVADRLATITGAQGLGRGLAVPLGAQAASDALLAGELDVALFVAPADAPYLQALLASEALSLRTLAHSEAIVLRMDGARLVRIPSGSVDYQRPLPPGDTQLIALVTRLLAREDLHPALVNRLVHAVIEVHGGGSIIPADRQYPSSRELGIAADNYASQLFEKGFSPLEQVLPYWIVAQLYRVLLVLLPALLLVLPLMRVLPALYQWFLRRRVFRHYARVHEIDGTLVRERNDLSVRAVEDMRDELDAIERKLLRLNLPNSYRKEAYTLLHHVDYVRRRSDEIIHERAAAGA